MNGIDEIIGKIISDAQAQADSIKAESDARIASLKREAQEKAEDRKKTYTGQLSAFKAETERRRNTVADLDIKKELLGKKKELIDTVYAKALEKLLSLPDKEYLELLKKLIEDNASDGDTVIVCKRDEKRVTKEFVSDIAKSKKIKLTLSPTTGNFSGGVVLSSEKLDKNLTFDAELKELAEENETKISSILFGE